MWFHSESGYGKLPRSHNDDSNIHTRHNNLNGTASIAYADIHGRSVGRQQLETELNLTVPSSEPKGTLVRYQTSCERPDA